MPPPLPPRVKLGRSTHGSPTFLRISWASARLRAAVVELTRLTDDDRTRADEKDLFQVAAPRHGRGTPFTDKSVPTHVMGSVAARLAASVPRALGGPALAERSRLNECVQRFT